MHVWGHCSGCLQPYRFDKDADAKPWWWPDVLHERGTEGGCVRGLAGPVERDCTFLGAPVKGWVGGQTGRNGTL